MNRSEALSVLKKHLTKCRKVSRTLKGDEELKQIRKALEYAVKELKDGIEREDQNNGRIEAVDASVGGRDRKGN